MRKVISLGIALMLGFLVGCGVNSEVEAKGGDAEFVCIGRNNGISIYKDNETGVHYLVYSTSNGIGITPRYTNLGSIYVD